MENIALPLNKGQLDDVVEEVEGPKTSSTTVSTMDIDSMDTEVWRQVSKSDADFD